METEEEGQKELHFEGENGGKSDHQDLQGQTTLK